jgi:hypothetical protein
MNSFLDRRMKYLHPRLSLESPETGMSFPFLIRKSEKCDSRSSLHQWNQEFGSLRWASTIGGSPCSFPKLTFKTMHSQRDPRSSQTQQGSGLIELFITFEIWTFITEKRNNAKDSEQSLSVSFHIWTERFLDCYLTLLTIENWVLIMTLILRTGTQRGILKLGRRRHS